MFKRYIFLDQISVLTLNVGMNMETDKAFGVYVCAYETISAKKKSKLASLG